jgi:N4-(beta-N-acetylglucosaminyl)-L-asparaginase
MISRRAWILTPAALAAAGAPPAAGRAMAIASANGLRACARAMEILRSGGDTLDAVVAGVNINEEDPEDHTVGYGGLPNEDGVVELDASVIHGPTRRFGAVASLRNIKSPSKVAQAVMQNTDHVMLAGEGALRFAKAFGFREDNLLTEKARLAWLIWKQSLRDKDGHNNWAPGLWTPPAKAVAALRVQFPGADDATLAWALEVARHPPTGTINCLALNAKGEMSGVTTTSGLAWKIPGRVGDSPIIGAGLYLDQDVGGAGATGRGEEGIRVCGAHTVVENMRHGMSPRDACLDALRRIARNYDGDLVRLARFDIRFYALRKDGQHGAGYLWRPASGTGYAVNEGGENRRAAAAYLLDRKV